MPKDCPLVQLLGTGNLFSALTSVTGNDGGCFIPRAAEVKVHLHPL